MRFYVLFVLVSACTQTHEVRVMPDASPDAAPDAGPVVDARDCCLLPDVEAISACANFPAHACGRLHCETSDGPHDIPICGPG